MKMLGGSSMPYFNIIMSQYYLVFSFVKNCLADSGLVHGILALLLSQHLVMQMKGNNDDI